MKTITQMASELHVDKQRVYRCIKKNNIIASYKSGIVMYYDKSAEDLIKKHFPGIDMINEANQESKQNVSCDMDIDAVIQIFHKELEAKNRQINDLTAALKNTTGLLNAAHALHNGTIYNQRQLTGFSLEKPDNNLSPENAHEDQKKEIGFVGYLKNIVTAFFNLFRRVVRADQNGSH